MGYAFGQGGVVVEEVPLAFVLTNGVVGGPANYWGEDYAAVGEGAVGVVAGGVAQQVGVTG